MGILCSFAPWVTYWMLVGDVPFGVSAVITLLVAAAAWCLQRAGMRGAPFEFGSLLVFMGLAIISFAASDRFSQHWLLALSFAGLFVVTLTGLLTGNIFVRRHAAAGLAADVVTTELFGRAAQVVAWVWVAAFGAMTVSASIPSVIDPDSTLFDMNSPLSYVCYWAVPTVFVALAALASKALPDYLLVGIDDVARSTTFVAFAEAEIDQLLFLAQEHANKEVGPGKEAYNVRLGGKGTPLVGDDTRESWPSTYKVRDKRR